MSSRLSARIRRLETAVRKRNQVPQRLSPKPMMEFNERVPILDFIKCLRESFEGSEYVYQNGSCYYFAKVLELMYPEGELWEFPHDHVIFKLAGKFYDIKGEVNVERRDIVRSEEPTPHGKFSMIDFLITKKY